MTTHPGVRYPADSKEYQHVTLVNDAAPAARSTGRKFRAFTAKHLDELIARAGLDPQQRLAVRAVGTVLPFRTNAYVVDELIDWTAPDDPIYRLVFPQADMLPAEDVGRIAGLLARDAPDAEIAAAAHEVRMRLNPHPAGQLALNIPDLGRRAAARSAAQIPGDRAGLPQAGPDLPRVLHVLLPLGPVRG